MKIHLKNIGSLLTALLLMAVVFNSCESENWKEHYNINSSIVSDKTVLEVIQSEPQFSKFAEAVRVAGYEEMLSSSQMFTAWVPTNDALAGFDVSQFTEENLLKEFVQNHVARFSYPASGDKESRITLLNKKQLDFKNLGGDFYIGSVKLSNKNIPAKNGVVHSVDAVIPFFSNIWEYISRGEELDSIRSFLFSFDEIIFDEAASIPGDVNEKGEIVYLDSVVINYNTMFLRMGYMNSEDSTYSMVIPTNTAWIEGYDRIKNYYNYYATEETQITADTLQRKNTLLAMTRDLVFSHTIQDMNQDTLRSTSMGYLSVEDMKKYGLYKNAFFYKPFEGLSPMQASNGMIYLTDYLAYPAWTSWHQKLVVEAERSTGRTNTRASLFERPYSGIEFDVSNNRYLEIVPSLAALNPTVTFTVPSILSGKDNGNGTVSGAAYNVYCVFLPNKIKSNNPKPNKVKFTIAYKDTNGREKKVNFTTNNEANPFTTSATEITKVLVAENFVFPFAEVELDEPSVKLTVESSVAAAETAQFTREMLIDYIVFEPAK